MIESRDLNLLLGKGDHKLTFQDIVKMIGNIGDKKPKYPLDEPVTIPTKAFYDSNAKPITTTLGVLIFNSVVLGHPEIASVIGFQDMVINGKAYGKIEDALTEALMEEKISVEAMHHFLDQSQALGNSLAFFISPSITIKSMTPDKEVEKRKAELIKQNKEALEAGDPVVAADIEKELLGMYREKLKGDAGMDLYDSGAGPDFNNNFKNSMVMTGPVQDTSTGKFKVATSAYMKGIKKTDIATYGNNAVLGAYAKAMNTGLGGYIVKKIMSAFQGVILSKKGSDCGSTKYREVVLEARDKNSLIYSYMLDRGKLVLLDSETYDKYVGKKVKIRSTLYCNEPAGKYCNVCAGDRYYKLEIENAGLTISRVGSSVMNKSLKKFHDISVKIHDVSIDKVIN